MMKFKAKPNGSQLDIAERSPLIVPKELECFAKSFNSMHAQGFFLGNLSSERESNQRSQFSQTRCMAQLRFMEGESALEPTPQALERTRQAAKYFFSLSYQLLNKNKGQFPLASRNKCLGMAVIPTTNLVMIAISQDKNPENDELLRQQMVHFLSQLNQASHDWKFELACIPTKAQYLMPRTFFMRTPHKAPQESVAPRTRCVEVALMVALCKAGRFLKFTSADIGIMAYGGTLWASSEGLDAIPHFDGAVRNIKYTAKKPIEVKLTDSMSGWVDVWEPCDDHCKIYKYEMLAIAAAGGPATSFMEPRAEWEVPQKKMG